MADVPLKPFHDDKGLTPLERAEVANKLLEKLGDRACEMCQHKLWGISETVVSLTPIITSEGPSHVRLQTEMMYPLLPVVCVNCGNTKLFQMRKLGVLRHLFAPEDADSEVTSVGTAASGVEGQ